MKTKNLYAVEVTDSTCNVSGHESGIYGKGDYSWVSDSLNGGVDAEYDMTKEEAEEVKADFERVIKEKNLEWASVRVDCVELPVAETLQDVADYYNESEDVSMLETLIDMVGAVDDCHETWGICHNDTEKVIVNDNGEAVVVEL